MDKTFIWEANLQQLFSDTNNIIIRAWVKEGLLNRPNISELKIYLACKDEDEFTFYDRLKIIHKDLYKYDDNSNLQLLNFKNEVTKEIPREKVFVFKDGDLVGKPNERFNFCFDLPLSKPISLEEFKKTNGLPTIYIMGLVKDGAIESLKEQQTEAIRYDADHAYDEMIETKMQNISIEPEDFEEARE